MGNPWFFLSKAKIRWLFSYYVLLVFLSIPLVVLALIRESISIQMPLTITEVTLIGSAGTAIAGCAIFYMRKLYKASINIEMSSPETEDQKYQQLGVFAYYLLRPLFSIVFSILIHILLKSSVDIITVKETRLDEGFIYLNMLLSFFAGFAAGDVLTYIEEKSKDLVTSIFKRNL